MGNGDPAGIVDELESMPPMDLQLKLHVQTPTHTSGCSSSVSTSLTIPLLSCIEMSDAHRLKGDDGQKCPISECGVQTREKVAKHGAKCNLGFGVAVPESRVTFMVDKGSAGTR